MPTNAITLPANSNEAARPDMGALAETAEHTRDVRTPTAEMPALTEQLQTIPNDTGVKRRKPAPAGRTKTDLVLKSLRKTKGTTIAQLTAATGWQAHSVRGFLSSVVRKKLGLNLVSDIGKDGQRRYRIIDPAGMAG